MEGIVRHARPVNLRFDIVLMQLAGADKIAMSGKGETPPVIQSHEQVAVYHGVPSIDLAREVTDRIDAGGFTWEQDFKSDVHAPPFGQALYARSIIRLLDHAWCEPPAAAAVTQPHPAPEALDEKSYFRGRLVDTAAVERDDGWALISNWTPSDKVATRPGFADVPMLVADPPERRAAFDLKVRPSDCWSPRGLTLGRRNTAPTADRFAARSCLRGTAAAYISSGRAHWRPIPPPHGTN